jgi:hypothetical protein
VNPARQRPPSPVTGADTLLDSLVVLVAEDRGYTCTPVTGDAMLLDGPHRLYVGMTNLRQLGRQVARDDWPSLVADHVSTIITAVEEPLDLTDFHQVGDLLRSRVYPTEADTGLLISRPFAAGLIEVIVADTPTTVRTVLTADTTHWPVRGAELFALGRSGVRSDGPLERDDQPVAGQIVTVLEGPTFYAATHLAWLDDYLELGQAGALVVIPNRGTIAAHAIRDAGANAVVAHLSGFARQGYEDGPGSLSPEVFWWRRGRLIMLERSARTGLPILPVELRGHLG